MNNPTNQRLYVSCVYVIGCAFITPPGDYLTYIGMSLIGVALLWNRWHLTIVLEDNREP